VQSSKLRNLARGAWRGRCWLAWALAARPAWAAEPGAPEPGSPDGTTSSAPGAAPAPDGASAPADGTQRAVAAGAAFKRGKALRSDGDLRGALREFERAYELSPAYQVLYFIGAVNVELEQWARARQAFELFLQLGGDQLSPENVAEVRVDLEELNKHTVTLTLTLNVAGAEVQVDGTTLTSTTISGLILETGEHVVRVSKPGFQPLEQLVKANEGENLHLVLPLAPLASETESGPGIALPTPGAGSQSVAGAPVTRDQAGTPWLPWAVTGALGAGWATTAVLAVKARHDRDALERPSSSDERIESARRLHITLAVVSDVLLATTLASAGVSAYVTWWSDPAPASAGPTASQSSLSPRGFSLGFTGRF